MNTYNVFGIYIFGDFETTLQKNLQFYNLDDSKIFDLFNHLIIYDL